MLITGALTGIGRATALAAFAREGAAWLSPTGRHEAGRPRPLVQFGVRRRNSSVSTVSTTKCNLINQAFAFWSPRRRRRNAGTEGKPGPVTEQSEKLRCHVRYQRAGTLLSMKHELRVMQPQGSGSIINLSSTMGQRGAPGASMYTASKHAVEGLTKAAALEGAEFGVRVNAVAPGPVETEMLNRFTGGADRKAGLIAGVPLKRAGKPEEIARAIVYLASDNASFVTGQILGVNGGKTAS